MINIHLVTAYTESGEVIQFCIRNKKEVGVGYKVNYIIYNLEKQFKISFKKWITEHNFPSCHMDFDVNPVTHTKAKGIGKGSISWQNNEYAPRCILKIGGLEKVL
jgi:hypothetical protein